MWTMNNVDKENEVVVWIGSIQEYSDNDEGGEPRVFSFHPCQLYPR